MSNQIEVWDYGITYGARGPQFARCGAEDPVLWPQWSGKYGVMEYRRCGSDAVKGVSFQGVHTGRKIDVLVCARHLKEFTDRAKNQG